MKTPAVATLALSIVALVLACSSDNNAGAGGGAGSPDGSSGSSGDDAAVADQKTPPTATEGCGAAVAKTGFLSGQSLTVGGTSRSYGVYLPTSYDPSTAYPIVVVFHGDGGNGEQIRSEYGTALEQLAGETAIFVYPDGEGATWNTDNLAPMTADIAFVDALALALEKTYCADKARVYLTGFSRGAYFANQMACRTKTAIRAVATHGGGGPYDVENDLQFDDNGVLLCPSPPVAALQTHGDQDGPEEGMKSRDHWAFANACGMSTSPHDPSPCVSYDGCAAGRPEVWCLIPGFGHGIWSEAPKATWSLFTSP